MDGHILRERTSEGKSGWKEQRSQRKNRVEEGAYQIEVSLYRFQPLSTAPPPNPSPPLPYSFPKS